MVNYNHVTKLLLALVSTVQATTAVSASSKVKHVPSLRSVMKKSKTVTTLPLAVLVDLRGGSSTPPPPSSSSDSLSTTTAETSESTISGSSSSSSTLDAPNSLPSNVELPSSISTGSDVSSSPAVEETTAVTKSKSKWSNVQERTLPALLMLGGVYGWIKYTGTNGVIALFTFLQAAMYSEGTNVVVSESSSKLSSLEKWFYFVTFWMNTSGRIIFPTEWANHKTLLDLIGYGMFAASIVGFVLKLNAVGRGGGTSGEEAVFFKSQLEQMSIYWMNALVLVGQSSFLFATLLEYGLSWIIYPALLVIVNDTMAYVFGFSMGKHPLLPQISPKKTWEGFVGAALSTMLLAKPLLNVCKIHESLKVEHALIIAAFISLISPFGGFLASVTKRAHGAKDFGTLIPGHGGVVDRFDCQVMTAPFIYFFLKHIMTVATTTTTEAA